MQRAPELIPLSHQHHHGLAAAKRVLGTLDIDTSDAGTRMLAEQAAHFHKIDLEPHFVAEETWLLPHAPAALRERTLTDHSQLRALVEFGSDLSAVREQLRTWSDMLTQHIRFEERELFPALQGLLSTERLRHIGRELESLETENPVLPGKPFDELRAGS